MRVHGYFVNLRLKIFNSFLHLLRYSDVIFVYLYEAKTNINFTINRKNFESKEVVRLLNSNHCISHRVRRSTSLTLKKHENRWIK